MTAISTKTTEVALAPILTKVAELLLINESLQDADAGQHSTLEHIRVCVESIANEVPALISTTKDLAASSDLGELAVACDLLRISGKDLLDSVQTFLNNCPTQKSRQAFASSARGVSECAIKVRLVAERALVKDILCHLQLVRDRLAALLSASSVNDLVPIFKLYALAVADAVHEVSAWGRDLLDTRLVGEIDVTVAALKRTAPLLCHTLQTHIGHPGNETAKASRAYVLGQVLLAVDKVSEIARAEFTYAGDGDTFVDKDKPGYFVGKMDQILEHMSSSERRLDLDSRYDAMLMSVIEHSVRVAYATSSVSHRLRIVHSCLAVLGQKRRLAVQASAVIRNADFSQLRAEFDANCEQLISEFHELERHVNAALLHGIVSVYKETTEPLDRLIRAVLSGAATTDHLLVTEKQPVKSYMDDFVSHSNSMYLLASFIADSSTEGQRVHKIKVSVHNLHKIDPELLPAILQCQGHDADPALLEHLQLLRKHWCRELQCLLSMIDEVTDPNIFLEISETQLKANIRELCSWQGWHCNLDSCRWFIDITRAVVGQAKRAAATAKHTISCSRDPAYRSAMSLHLANLRQTISDVCRSAQQLTSLSLEKYMNGQSAAYIGRDSSGDMQALAGHLVGSSHVMLDCLGVLRSYLLSPNLHQAHNEMAASYAMISKSGANGAAMAYVTADNKMVAAVMQPLVCAEEQARKPSGASESQESKICTNTESFQEHSSLHSISLSSKPVEDSHRFLRIPNDLMPHASQATAVQSEVADIFIDKASINRHASNLVELQKWLSCVVELAVSCNGQKAEQLWEVLLGRACSTVAAVDAIVASSQDDGARLALAQHRDAVSNITLEMSDKLKALALLTTNDIAAVQQASDIWCSKVVALERICDSHLACYKRLSDRVVEAAVQIDEELFKKEAQHFEQVQSSAGQLLTTAHKRIAELLSNHSSSSAGTAEAAAKEVVAAGMKLMEQISKMRHCATANTFERPKPAATTTTCQLFQKKYAASSLSLTWAAKLFSLESETIRKCNNICLEVECDGESDAQPPGHQDYARATREAADMFNAVTLCCSDELLLSGGKQILSEATELVYTLAAAEKPIHSASALDLRRMRVAMIRCDWRAKVSHLYSSIIDPVLSKSCRPLHVLAVAAIRSDASLPLSAAAGSPVAKTSLGIEVQSLLQRLLQGLSQVSSSILKAAEAASAPSDWCMAARHSMELLSTTLTNLQLSSLLNDLTKSPNERMLRRYRRVQRTWACAIVRLCTALKNAGTAGQSTWQAVQAWLAELGIAPINVVNGSSTMEFDTPVHMLLSREGHPSGWLDLLLPTLSNNSTLDSAARESLHGHDKAASYSGDISEKSVSFLHQPHPGAMKTSFTDSHKFLDVETSMWKDERNPVVRAARDIAHQLRDMTAYAQLEGPLEDNAALCAAAMKVASQGQVIFRFAQTIARYAFNQRLASELLACAEKIPVCLAQLNILANARKESAEDTMVARKMLTKAAENSMHAITDTMQAVEAACVKGLCEPGSGAGTDEHQAVALIKQWRRQLHNHRRIEVNTSDFNDLGLRITAKQNVGPRLCDIVSS